MTTQSMHKHLSYIHVYACVHVFVPGVRDKERVHEWREMFACVLICVKFRIQKYKNTSTYIFLCVCMCAYIMTMYIDNLKTYLHICLKEKGTPVWPQQKLRTPKHWCPLPIPRQRNLLVRISRSDSCLNAPSQSANRHQSWIKRQCSATKKNEFAF